MCDCARGHKIGAAGRAFDGSDIINKLFIYYLFILPLFPTAAMLFLSLSLAHTLIIANLINICENRMQMRLLMARNVRVRFNEQDVNFHRSFLFK